MPIDDSPSCQLMIVLHAATDKRAATVFGSHHEVSGLNSPRRTATKPSKCQNRGCAQVPFVPRRALPTETQVESGMSQSKSGTAVNLSNSGKRDLLGEAEEVDQLLVQLFIYL